MRLVPLPTAGGGSVDSMSLPGWGSSAGVGKWKSESSPGAGCPAPVKDRDGELEGPPVVIFA